MYFNLGQAAIRCRPGRRHRPDAARIRLETPLGKGPEPKDRGCMIGATSNMADLEVEESNDANPGLWTRGLLIRRRIADDDLAFFTTWCPAGTSIETLVASKAIGGQSRTVLRPPRTSSWLDHNESRSWHGWHSHVSMVMLAFAMMAAIRHLRQVRRRQKKPAAEPRQKTKASPRRH